MTKNFKLIWVESICTLQDVIEKNILKTKVTSPDYKFWEDAEKAADDFRKRIGEYEKIYEPLGDKDSEDTCYIQLINQGARIVLRNIKGYIESKLVSFLLNLHTGDRPIYFSRHGECEYNISGKLGGDSLLTEEGVNYTSKLAHFFKEEKRNWTEYKEGPTVFSSTMKRSIDTAQKLSFLSEPIIVKGLDEISLGNCDGLSMDEIKINFAQEYVDWNNDKLKYRLPRGESFLDVIERIEPMIYEIERRTGPVILICHTGVIRCLYGYFACVPVEEIPSLDIPLHTIIKFIPEAYGFNEKRYKIANDGTVYEDNSTIAKFTEKLIHTPK